MKINAIVPCNRTGYGIAGMGYLNGILDTQPDLEVSLLPIGQIDPNDSELKHPRFQRLLPLVDNKPDWDAPTFIFWHLHDIPNHITQCKGPILGATTFECVRLKKEEIFASTKLGLTLTASKWGTNVLATQGVPTGAVIPHALKYLNDEPVPTIKIENHIPIWNGALGITLPKDTLILSNCGKFEVRKGHPELIDAVLEIGQERPVLLVLYCFNPFVHGGYRFDQFIVREMEPVYTTSGIKLFKKGKAFFAIMPPTATRQELHGALSRAHFYIAPSKGEGWNLPLFEMMSYGMPCIASDNTGHTEYVNQKNAVPIASGKIVTAYDPPFFHGNEQWFEVPKDYIVHAIRKAASLTESEVLEISNEARETTKEFSWQKSGKILMNQLKSLM